VPNESTQQRQRGRLYRVFINPEERRLRTGWRILCFSVIFIVTTLLAQLPFAFAMGVQALPPWAEQFLFYAFYLAALLLTTWLARRFLDRRPFLDLGLRLGRGWWADLLFGAALGGVLMAGITLVEWAAGWLEFRGFAWQTVGWDQLLLSLASAFFVYIAVGVNEELMMRGYVMQNLAEALNMRWAVIISSVVFGLLHMGNPYASWVSTLNVAVAGVFLAAGYLVTRSLWLPLGGFHLIRQTVAGPEWVTGGPFGPEAGLTGLTAMVVGTALIWLWGRGLKKRNAENDSAEKRPKAISGLSG
jgi:membrane protease YdiL (CAAX protease family)